ncbi:UAA transporter [Tulasnella sp. UAMH 9824]|nr:UAA transporter [Tulasnella sp. UAMH 9824]
MSRLVEISTGSPLDLGGGCPSLTIRRDLTLAQFSVLYTLNIVVSNLSLQLATDLGDDSLTAWGFILMLETLLAALKTVLTSILQTPSAASQLWTPLPVATPAPAQLGYEYVLPPSPTFKSFTNGNVPPSNLLNLAAANTSAPRSTSPPPRLPKRCAPLKHPLFKRFGSITKRFDMDFGDVRIQTVVSTSIKLHPLGLLMRIHPLTALDTKVGVATATKNGPLTMTLAANVKQVSTILFTMYMFHLTITPANSIDITLNLAGGAWYSALEYEEKGNRLRMM